MRNIIEITMNLHEEAIANEQIVDATMVAFSEKVIVSELLCRRNYYQNESMRYFDLHRR